ncbi:hypothetical protein [Natrinema amylolyticum]|uniref:hypothetical protein n=1 Tax=Natrinema amylolyticum TaxID=2878679 RepID=UPI001CFBB337|nr:hypothetical protein [Natrinema amylolyticum]
MYTLRELEGGLPALLRCIGETDFDGAEFAGFGETSPDEAATVLETIGLEAAGVHVEIDAGWANAAGYDPIALLE